MSNYNNINYESELYEPMRLWLHQYLENNYKGYKIITYDSHAENLYSVLSKFGIVDFTSSGIEAQIDVLGIAIKGEQYKLFFIEAKKNNLTLKDLGQILIYCKLFDPEEAFLMSSSGLGSLNHIIKVLRRYDLLYYGDTKLLKKIKVKLWSSITNSPSIFGSIT